MHVKGFQLSEPLLGHGDKISCNLALLDDFTDWWISETWSYRRDIMWQGGHQWCDHLSTMFRAVNQWLVCTNNWDTLWCSDDWSKTCPLEHKSDFRLLKLLKKIKMIKWEMTLPNLQLSNDLSICQGVEGLPLNQQGVCNGQGAIMANTLAAADVVSDEGMRGKVRHGIL